VSHFIPHRFCIIYDFLISLFAQKLAENPTINVEEKSFSSLAVMDDRDWRLLSGEGRNVSIETPTVDACESE
jgi:hypothetical protein